MSDSKILFLIGLAWAVAAYVIAPELWALYFRHHPFLAELARVTQTGDGHPGDPINTALVGTEAELVRAMTAAGWFSANPITIASSARIPADTVLHRPDSDAPVSNLFLFGRKQGALPSSSPSEAAQACALLAVGRIVWTGPAGFGRRRST